MNYQIIPSGHLEWDDDVSTLLLLSRALPHDRAICQRQRPTPSRPHATAHGWSRQVQVRTPPAPRPSSPHRDVRSALEKIFHRIFLSLYRTTHSSEDRARGWGPGLAPWTADSVYPVLRHA